eukprot:m.91473 g.91473  ORF g.91473 m.91473 type:complete len:183 (+) comp15040_c0_seq1:646-1194(+)
MWWLIYGAASFASLLLLERLYIKLRSPGFNVRKQHVFITGGSSGLGLSTAICYAKAGALVTIASRSEAKLIAARRHIIEAVPDAQVHTESCDVSDEKAVNAAVASAVAVQSRDVDIAVCSAGLSATGRFAETDVQTHRAQMDLNFFGTLHVVKVCGTKQAEDQGVIRGPFILLVVVMLKPIG